MIVINAKGLPCPAPVMQTKAEVETSRPEAIKVIVDNEAAWQNVTRFLESTHYQTDVEQKENDFYVFGRREKTADEGEDHQEETAPGEQKIMMMISTDRIGRGDDGLGAKLMVNYIGTLKEMGPALWRMVFVNNGVKLCIDDSNVLPALQELEAEGVKILVCGTCLSHFDLMDRKQVGETTNMLDIVTAMHLSGKVINI
jgi:selenium metabolism protein YedF